MSQVSYDGKRLIPAPLVSIEKLFNTSPDGSKIGTTFNLTLSGNIVGYKGSPNKSGIFHTTSGYPDDEDVEINSRLSALQRKAEAIRELFAQDGLAFIIQALDGTTPMRCYPRVVSINFAEGIWTDVVPYTIILEADEILPKQEDGYTEFLQSASEVWSIETSEDAEGIGLPVTYTLTHTIEAQGKRHFDSNGLEKPAWQQARDWVLPRLGFDATIALSSGVNNLPSYYGGFNHARGETVDEMAGSFAVTESWVLASGAALEEFVVNTEASVDGLTLVTVEGQVRGLEERTSDLFLSSSKFDNASGRFNTIQNQLYARAKHYSGVNLNPVARNTSVGRNPVLGVITYGYTYDTRPVGIVQGAKSEIISVVDDLQQDTFAVIPVLGRTTGHLLQAINTKSPKRRTLNIECIFEPSGFGGGSVAEIRNVLVNSKPTAKVADIISACDPANMGATKSFKEVNDEEWNPTVGSYRRTLSWTYEN